MVPQKHIEPTVRPATLTIPELEQSKEAVLNTLASVHSRRSYAFAIDRFIAWYCSEPGLTFNRAVVVRYRSHLEGLSLSASTINSHLSAIRRLADESAESGWLTPELAIGIRRVQGVKRLGRKIGNWLSRSQAEELVNAASKADLRGWRDGAIVGLLLGCGSSNIYPEGVVSFPPLLLDHGYRGFIGPESKIPDDFAGLFAGRLYKSFLEGDRLGEAILKTRCSFLTTHANPLGILYTMYANPNFRVRKPN